MDEKSGNTYLQSSMQRNAERAGMEATRTQRQGKLDRKTRTTLATITPIEYHGNVWCVQVPTGAFVARRNGHIFITGNSGFPKSMDISKAIDKAAGAEREKIINPLAKKQTASVDTVDYGDYNAVTHISPYPATPEAQQWDGWGTALKPAHEPIVVARKPLSEKTIVDNVLKWGTGGINIDGCRIETTDILNGGAYAKNGSQRKEIWGEDAGNSWRRDRGLEFRQPQGRFPANVILDEEAGKMLDGQSGIKKGNGKQTVSFHKPSKNNCMSGDNLGHTTIANIGDSGGASRFFYCAKASKKERGDSKHPTVKPLSLMRYLCRLITPPEGIVLDPFAGSGTTLEAAILEGFNVVGIEKEHDYIPDIRRRIERAQLNTQAPDMGLFLFSEEARS
jgi:site-specific DNA-methyltransferase (adenine-specific)